MPIHPQIIPYLIASAFFITVIIATIGGAAVSVLANSLIYNLMGLILSLIGVAGLYWYLHSPFISIMQILIYVGAVGILMVFGIMLVGPKRDEGNGYSTRKMALGSLTALVFFVTILTFVLNTKWMSEQTSPKEFSVKVMGAYLLREYSLVFELISVVILVAIIGSIIIAWGGRRKR